jgi:hypothetical protein
MMADKSCLNKLCGLGVTALGMAAQHGSLPLCRVLLKANIDPNAGLARTPLNAALEWLGKCHKREKRSWKTTETGEKKLATKLLKEAEETVNLLRAHGAVDELRPFNPYSAISSGEFKQAAPEVSFPVLVALRLEI